MEAGFRARGVLWIAIAALACGLCYSIGFQSGWTQGTDSLNGRLNHIDDALHNLAVETSPDDGDLQAATDGAACATG